VSGTRKGFRKEEKMPSAWQELEPNVYRFHRDSCYVYAVRGPEGTVLVNAGTGRAADHLSELESRGKATLLLTHHFRDHTDGAIRLHAAGVEVLGNYWDREYYLDPEQHFRERQTWNSYDNRWDRFAPVRPLPVSDWMRDYETRRIAGLSWEVVPTPGHTNGASSYIVTLPGGRRVAFVGETICGPGRTSRLAPLQYNYNDLDGAANLWHSCNRLLDAKPDLLFPSLGDPIDNPAEAIATLKANIRRIDEMMPGFAGNLYDLNDPNFDEIEEVLPHLYRSRSAVAETHFVLSDSGRVLALDYGYNSAAAKQPQRHHISTRRSFLHGIKGLKRHFGIERIDTVLASHYHDDHVNGIPLLQRLYGTEVWAAEHFADILESPERYDRPCLWYEPIPVTRRLPCGETFTWENIPITLYPMSGHTRFSTLICLEVDGTRIAHTGDQIFFQPWEYESGAKLFTNHVYKNGLDLGCYLETWEHLQRFRPDLVLTGHTRPYRTTPEWLAVIEKGARAFDDVHRRLMPLGDEDVHFGPESQAAKLKPYHAHLPDGGPITFDAWVINPFQTAQTATLRLIAPDGWTSEPISLSLGPRERKAFSITLTPPPAARCRRQPVALDLTVGDQPFGQVTEALVSVGMPRF
jgi:glyoxylase-like metal-dependent hydrolase (beta-lactamase superfamily II)